MQFFSESNYVITFYTKTLKFKKSGFKESVQEDIRKDEYKSAKKIKIQKMEWFVISHSNPFYPTKMDAIP